MIRYETTRARPVVSREEGAIVGKFDDFQFDIRTWSIYGYRLRSSSMFGRAGGVLADDLDQVGRDVVFITSEARVEWTGGARNPEDGRAWASRYLGTKVISRDGTALGEVDDLVFCARTDALVALILSGERIVELGRHVATGSAAVVIEDASFAVLLPEAEEDHENPTNWWASVRKVFSKKDKPEPDADAPIENAPELGSEE
jgi:uncharacterized protein YrrD